MEGRGLALRGGGGSEGRLLAWARLSDVFGVGPLLPSLAQC